MRALVFAGLAAVSACGPAPAQMSPTRASELLERFAAGAGVADICTAGGRAELRGAVRAYGAAMQESGVEWPVLPPMGDDPARLSSVDISVLIAFAAGFVDASDFRGQARGRLQQLWFAHWPEVRGMREAARDACDEVVALQRAAARLVMETERLRVMTEDGQRAPPPERLQRQHERVERAHLQMQQQAAAVSARVEAARAG